MTNASVKVTLHSTRYKDGTQPVMLQCRIFRSGTHFRNRKVICRTLGSHFDRKTGRLKPTHPHYKLLNPLISQELSDTEGPLTEQGFVRSLTNNCGR